MTIISGDHQYHQSLYSEDRQLVFVLQEEHRGMLEVQFFQTTLL